MANRRAARGRPGSRKNMETVATRSRQEPVTDRCMESDADRRIKEPVTDKSMESGADRRIMESDADRRSLEPVANRRIMESDTDRRVLEPVANRRIMESDADRRSLEPVANRRIMESDVDRRVLEPVANRRIMESDADRRIMEFGADRRILEPVAYRRIMESDADRRSLEPIANRRIMESDADRRILEPVANRRIMESDADRRVLEPVANRRIMDSDADRRILEPVANRRIMESGADRRVLEPVANRRIMESGADRRTLEPVANRRIVESGANRRMIESGANRRIIEFGANRRIMESGGDRRSLESIANRRNMAMVNDRRILEPAAIRKDLRVRERFPTIAEMTRESMRRSEKWKRYFTRAKSLLIWLEWQGVKLEVDPLPGNPLAEFQCTHCRYCCDTLDVVERHITDARHAERAKRSRVVTTANNIPRYVGHNQLRITLEAVLDKRLLRSVDIEERLSVLKNLNQLISACGAGEKITAVGSVVSGLGARGLSDTNFEIEGPNERGLEALADRLESLGVAGLKRNVDPPFPRVMFDHPKGSGVIDITYGPKEKAVFLELIFKRYRELDKRTVELCCLMRVWAEETKLIDVWPHHVFYLLVIFFLQQLPVPVLPVLEDHEDKHENWKSDNKTDLATLWTDMFRFYAVDLDSGKRTIDITKGAEPSFRRDKGWMGGWLGVLDPAHPRRNALRKMPESWTKYAAQIFSNTFLYCCLPQTKQGPAIASIRPTSLIDDLGSSEIGEYLQEHKKITSGLVKLIPLTDDNYRKPTEWEEREGKRWLETAKLQQHVDYCGLDPGGGLRSGKQPLGQVPPPPRRYSNLEVDPHDAAYLMDRLLPRALLYTFTRDKLTGGEPLPKVCPLCAGSDGHWPGGACPLEEAKDSPPQLPAPFDLCPLEAALFPPPQPPPREPFLAQFQTWIRNTWKPEAILTAFGSSANGFGTNKSDLDICMTFEGNPKGEHVDQAQLVTDLYRELGSHSEIQPVSYVTHAKVPIVKFIDKTTKLHGDISFYNTLAITNSKLLFTYSKLDPRARSLVLAMKRLAGLCGVGDASKGGLSSYSFTLMVLYFLQQTYPAVLPVLQEMGKSPKDAVKPPNPDTYFLADIERINKLWTERGSNKKTVAALWLDCLEFYARRFDYLREVITIRRWRIKRKVDRFWNSRCITIEDPFEDRNLASGISANMSNRIIRMLRKAYVHFGRSWTGKESEGDPDSFFWDCKHLVEEIPHEQDICCYRVLSWLKIKTVDVILLGAVSKGTRATGAPVEPAEASSPLLLGGESRETLLKAIGRIISGLN